MGAVNLFSPTRKTIWNPDEQFNLDPTTGQYTQQPPPQIQQIPQPNLPDLGRDPGTPDATRRGTSVMSQGPFPGWNAQNIFEIGDDLSGLAEQTGISRDELANQRDAFGRSLEESFRQAQAAQGLRTEETSATLFNDPRFRQFATSGQLPTMTTGPALTPSLFDDPSTKQLETTVNNQMKEIRDNPALNQLLAFLDSQFANLSQSPGFSPEEMAVLNTQAFEPIEDLRKASTERSLQRTANRGFLPSSGLAELDLRQIDRDADRMRTQANRDLAVNAIDRRDADLGRAMQYATTRGLTIPQGQRAEELNLSNLLYQLPSNALKDLLAVLQGSPGASNLLQGAQASAYQQQLQRQQTEEMWRNIAALIGSMNF